MPGYINKAMLSILRINSESRLCNVLLFLVAIDGPLMMSSKITFAITSGV